MFVLASGARRIAGPEALVTGDSPTSNSELRVPTQGMSTGTVAS